MSALALALALSGPGLPPPTGSLDADGDGVLDSLERRAAGEDPETVLSILVGLRTPPSAALVEVVERAGGRVTGRFERLVYLLTVDVAAGDLPALLVAVGPELTWAQADGPLRGTLLNATRLVRVRDVWSGLTPGLPALGGAGVRVGVIDSGVDDDHPDLRGKVDRWIDVVGPAGDGLNLYAEPHDRRGHGTGVASVAAGAGSASQPRAYRLTMSRRFPPEEGAGWTQGFTLGGGGDPRAIRFAAEWEGGGEVGLSIRDPDGAPRFTGSSGDSPWTWSSGLENYAPGRAWSAFFFTRRQDDVETRDTSYFASLEVPHEALDDFPLMSGVARDAFVAACKALDDRAQAGGVGRAIQCLEWMGEVADVDGLAAVNLSLNYGGVNGPLDTAVNELVIQHGVAVVVSAGNDQQEGRAISSPGTAALALTVGAHNTEGAVTLYSSLGVAGDSTGKPDAVAPGGSRIAGSPMFVADANDAHCKAQDWECGRDEDPYPDDHAGAIGTSLAAPIAVGAMALLAQARGGALGDPLEAKALMLMTSMETGDVREIHRPGDGEEIRGASPGPPGGPERPWDRVEGYGRLSVEAFLEAGVAFADQFPAGGALSSEWAGRQVWARRVRVPQGEAHRFALYGPPGALYGLRLYDASPDEVGRPILVDSGVAVAIVAEGAEREAVLVVRRNGGEGAFTVARDVRAARRCAGHPEAGADAPQRDDFCTLGQGGCERTGRWSCDDQGWAMCETQLGTPAQEVCANGVDDDCDGQTDEEDVAIGEECDTAQLGPCARGVRVCVDGSLVCEGRVGPVDETCDGLDQDCDGATDEGFAVGQECSAGEGACRREGVVHCALSGDVAVCDAVPGPPVAERCGEGIDDDCDGAVDEGFEDLGAPCTVGIGACAVTQALVCGDFGNLVCGAESRSPGEETCGDGVDGDCDGVVDERCDAPGAGEGGCGCRVGASASGGPLSWLMRLRR